MHPQILKRLREKIRLRQYVVTLHADEEMDDDGLTIFDVERAVLTGTVVERQRDRKTRESKYLVRGETLDGSALIVIVVKLGQAGKAIILTAYRE